MENNLKARKKKDNLLVSLVYLSAIITVGLLVVIVGFMVLVSILVATPIGILAAVYLQEYAKQGKLVRVIRFATECLAGIPSIVYGLFGGIFFVVALKLQYSILSGGLTVAIIILPTIIRSTEEALKTVPDTYREASLGLGATKFQTLYKLVNQQQYY